MERVRTGSAYGNYEDLREAAEGDPSLLDQPDEMGFYPLQWAALNNRVAIISFLIDKSVDINRYGFKVSCVLVCKSSNFACHATPKRRLQAQGD